MLLTIAVYVIDFCHKISYNFSIEFHGEEMIDTEHITEVFRLDKKFPFTVFKGKGFSAENVKNGNVYMHNHYCLEINMALSSGGTYYIGESSYPLNKNDIFVINNYEFHYAANTTDDMELMVIIFDPELVWRNDEMDYLYIKAFYEWKDGFKHRLAAEAVPKDITETIYEIEREWNQKAAGYQLVIKSLLLKLLALLYRRFEETGRYSEKILKFQNEYIRIIDAINYIDANFREPVTLKELSEIVHMNQNYFSSYFHKVMNCSVSTYIIRRRLKHACLLLTTTDESIIEIASDSGFENVPYFNRTFKKHLGMTPGEYRNNANA